MLIALSSSVFNSKNIFTENCSWVFVAALILTQSKTTAKILKMEQKKFDFESETFYDR